MVHSLGLYVIKDSNQFIKELSSPITSTNGPDTSLAIKTLMVFLSIFFAFFFWAIMDTVLKISKRACMEIVLRKDEKSEIHEESSSSCLPYEQEPLYLRNFTTNELDEKKSIISIPMSDEYCSSNLNLNMNEHLSEDPIYKYSDKPRASKINSKIISKRVESLKKSYK